MVFTLVYRFLCLGTIKAFNLNTRIILCASVEKLFSYLPWPPKLKMTTKIFMILSMLARWHYLHVTCHIHHILVAFLQEMEFAKYHLLLLAHIFVIVHI